MCGRSGGDREKGVIERVGQRLVISLVVMVKQGNGTKEGRGWREGSGRDDKSISARYGEIQSDVLQLSGLIESFQKYDGPTQYLTLDEGLISAKSRLGIKK